MVDLPCNRRGVRLPLFAEGAPAMDQPRGQAQAVKTWNVYLLTFERGAVSRYVGSSEQFRDPETEARRAQIKAKWPLLHTFK